MPTVFELSVGASQNFHHRSVLSPTALSRLSFLLPTLSLSPSATEAEGGPPGTAAPGRWPPATQLPAAAGRPPAARVARLPHLPYFFNYLI